MIKVDIIEIAGFASALKALRLPFSKECRSECNHNYYTQKKHYSEVRLCTDTTCVINEKDIALMSTLVRRGDEHSKVVRGLIAYMDIEAPVYWWCELETYRAGHERLSSQSTMHVEGKGLSGDELVEVKSQIPMGKILRKIDFFSYQCLRNIVKQRHNHRLPEWKVFIDKLHSLPYAEELIFTGLNQNNNE